jgi:hypothetical protein
MSVNYQLIWHGPSIRHKWWEFGHHPLASLLSSRTVYGDHHTVSRMKEELLCLLDERDPLLRELSRLLVLLGGFAEKKSDFKVSRREYVSLETANHPTV